MSVSPISAGASQPATAAASAQKSLHAGQPVLVYGKPATVVSADGGSVRVHVQGESDPRWVSGSAVRSVG